MANNRNRRYLARDFESFKNELLTYARRYYPNQIQDFSDASVGGLFLDMASYVGDNLSFYLDHLYGELNPETAVENISIERALKNAGVPVVGASPAVVNVTAYIEVQTEEPGDISPSVNLLPIIKEGTVFSSENGTLFTLIEDINFAFDENEDGNYVLNPKAEKKIAKLDAFGRVLSYFLSLSGLCVSGKEKTETFYIDNFEPFRTITLSQKNVTEVINVYDDKGNTYYEVGALTHDVVYKNVNNSLSDKELVKDSMVIIPAPYRFTKTMSLANKTATLTFGGGSADTLEDDVIPDPSEFAIAFPYSKTISRVPVNPEKLLKTNTLGIMASSTTLTIIYRYGGGLSHNVSPGSIRSITKLIIEFPKNSTNTDTIFVRNSLEITNLEKATGGEDPPTKEDLVALIPLVKNSQERVVTKEDLLARIYTMPSNFGRVFRASIASNPNNPLATQLFIISRDSRNKLTTSPDTLKINLKKYLNSYRMISDAIDILDAKVINLQLKIAVVIDPSLNRTSVLSSILTNLQTQFQVKKMYIDQPINMSDVVSTIFKVKGVIAVDNVQFVNIFGTVDGREYSSINYDVNSYTKRQILYPLPGGIFEIRYPEVDIIAKAVA